MKDSSIIRFAGDVHIKEVSLTSLNGNSVNITNQVTRIEIYEDIFSPFITLSIVVREALDFLNGIPIVGEEYVVLEIDTPTLNTPIKGKFYVYKVTDKEYTKERESTYAIKCISEEYITDVNTKISKPISGNISQSAQLLLGKEGLQTKKTINVEKTSNVTKFIANFWNPSKCLSTLATTAANINNSPTYLFYENRDGFNFRSIEELIKVPTYQEFIKDNYVRTTVSSDSVKSILDIEQDYKRILDLSIPVVSDYMKDVETGRLKSRVISHDILTKKYTVKDYSLKKDPKQPSLLNEFPAYSKFAQTNSASTMLVMPKYYGNFNNFADVTNHKTIQKRMSFFQNLEKFKVNIEVPGRTDYTVGKVVYLKIPKAAQIQKNEVAVDEMLSGRYLISAVSHTISRDSHTCHVELIKNSVIRDLSKG